jgi:hypothetical protein
MAIDFVAHSAPRAFPQSKPVPKTFKGRGLVAQLKDNTPDEKAVLAVELTGASITRIPQRLAMHITGANAAYVAAASKLTPDEREAVWDGTLKLADRINGHRKPPTARDMIAALVTEIGTDGVFDELVHVAAAKNGNGSDHD